LPETIDFYATDSMVLLYHVRKLNDTGKVRTFQDFLKLKGE